MGSLVRLVHDKFYAIIMLLIAGGFVIIVAELLWTEHYDGIQLVGLLASIAGVVLGVAALFVKGSARLVIAVLFLLLSITGIVGVLEHNEARGGGEGEAYQQIAPAGYEYVSYRLQETDEKAAESGGESGAAIPPLAPLGLSGLALMGAVVTLTYSGEDVDKKAS